MATTPQRRGHPDFENETNSGEDNKQTQAAEPTISEVLALVQKMQAENAEKDRTIDALKKSVDQTAFNSAVASQRKDERPCIRLRLVDDKPLKSWTNMLTNDVKVHQGEIIENQTVKLTFLDGTTKETSYNLAFNTKNRTGWIPVVAKTVRDGKTFYTIEYEEKEYDIEETFINA